MKAICVYNYLLADANSLLPPEMENFWAVIVVFGFPFFLTFCLFVSFYITGKGYILSKILRPKQPLSPLYVQILEKHFTYYQQLSRKEKIRFQGRVNDFIINKEFIPMLMETVTDEMKVLLSACAVQITFGLQEIILMHFQKILIFPEKFLNARTGRFHLGEVNMEGYIAISWKDFQAGYLNTTDAYNVGLHEMAHALQLENYIFNEEYHFFKEKHMHKWANLYKELAEKIRLGEITFLRKYASVDEDEFFAVSVEYFFERPLAFKQNLPHVYKTLVRILKQDPAARKVMVRKR